MNKSALRRPLYRGVGWLGCGLLLGGCAKSQPPARPLAAPVVRSERKPEPAMPNLSLRHYQTIDGRALAVYGAKAPKPDAIRGNYKEEIIWGLQGHDLEELREVSTGKVLIPAKNQQIMLVPGRGVFVREIAGGKSILPRQNWKLRIDFYNQLRQWRDAPGFRPPGWDHYDVATGQRQSTPIVAIEAHLADRAADSSLPEELRKPSYLFVYEMQAEQHEGRWIGRLDAETVSSTGERLAYFPYFAPAGEVRKGRAAEAANLDQLLQGGRRFSIAETYRADGSRQQHLLGRLLEPLASPEETIREVRWGSDAFKGTYAGSVIIKRAEEEDTWTVLQPSGVFGTPPGIRWVRPVYQRGNSGDISGWLVRYAFRGEPGYQPLVNPIVAARAWGFANPGLTMFSGPQWDEVKRVDEVTSADPNQLYATEFRFIRCFLARRDGVWMGFEVEQRSLNGIRYTERVDRTGRQPDIDSTLVALRRGIAADYNRRMNELMANMEQASRRLFESAWEEGKRTGDYGKMLMAANQLGGDYWMQYVNSVPKPSARLLEHAAARVNDPVKAKRLREWAEQQREADLREAEAQRKRMEAEFAAQKAQANQYQQSAASSPSRFSGSWNLPAPSYKAPELSQQQRDYLYTTKLNTQIYGTPWDPY